MKLVATKERELEGAIRVLRNVARWTGREC